MVAIVKKQETTVAQAIRAAVAAAVEQGRSINSIAADAGIPQPVLQRWWSGARPDIRLSTAEQLCRYFGIKVH